MSTKNMASTRVRPTVATGTAMLRICNRKPFSFTKSHQCSISRYSLVLFVCYACSVDRIVCECVYFSMCESFWAQRKGTGLLALLVEGLVISVRAAP